MFHVGSLRTSGGDFQERKGEASYHIINVYSHSTLLKTIGSCIEFVYNKKKKHNI